jgi:general secretion pathway protein D
VLANPRIRVKNREKARVHIGDRVPVITTTAAATGGFVSESVTYLDVGLKLEVEPLISLEDEVNMKVSLEVSNITQTVKSTSGTLTYQLGTRTAATNLRLRDGETQVLAGLISNDDRRSADRVPVLGELPIAGRLFSHTLDNNNRTEIVLLITPRLARTLARPDAASVEFAAGTEAATGTPRLGAAPPVIPQIPVPTPVPGATPGQPQGTSGEQEPSLIQPAKPATGPQLVPFGGVKPPAQ